MGDAVRIEYMPLGELLKRKHPRNPKDHDLGAIITSVKRWGYNDPGTLDERTGFFAEGHGRTNALAMLKADGGNPPQHIEAREDDWYVPVQRGVTFNSDSELEAYLVAHNRLTTLGGWNEPELVALLQDLAAQDEALLEATGYDADDLQALIDDLAPVEAPEDFNEYGEDIETEYCCPKCGYKWSGKANASDEPEA